MKTVIVGPKYFRSNLPVGEVPETVAQQIDLANSGRMGKQMYPFNIKIKDDGLDAVYARAYLINGACRFKKYNFLDKIAYQVGRLFPLKGKNPYNG